MAASDRQHDLDTHVLPLVHQLPVNEDLICADTVANGIGGICDRRNLDLAPLLVRRYDLA